MRQLTLVLLFLTAPLLAGCEAVAVAVIAGVGGYFAYSTNEVAEDYLVDFDEMWAAAERSLDLLHYSEDRKVTQGANDGKVEVDDLWLKIERHPNGVVRVRARVGTFVTTGHKRRGRVLLESIEKDLGVKPIVSLEEFEPETPPVQGPQPATE